MSTESLEDSAGVCGVCALKAAVCDRVIVRAMRAMHRTMLAGLLQSGRIGVSIG